MKIKKELGIITGAIWTPVTKKISLKGKLPLSYISKTGRSWECPVLTPYEHIVGGYRTDTKHIFVSVQWYRNTIVLVPYNYHKNCINNNYPYIYARIYKDSLKILFTTESDIDSVVNKFEDLEFSHYKRIPDLYKIKHFDFLVRKEVEMFYYKSLILEIYNSILGVKTIEHGLGIKDEIFVRLTKIPTIPQPGEYWSFKNAYRYLDKMVVMCDKGEFAIIRIIDNELCYSKISPKLGEILFEKDLKQLDSLRVKLFENKDYYIER